jgi:hypothetical protein
MVIASAVAETLADEAAALVAATEAPSSAFLQVRSPARSLLADNDAVVAHASALRQALDLTGLRLILHAPDDLLAGTPEHDRQLDGALTYASVAGSELMVYHGARIPVADASVRARLGDEERCRGERSRLESLPTPPRCSSRSIPPDGPSEARWPFSPARYSAGRPRRRPAGRKCPQV